MTPFRSLSLFIVAFSAGFIACGGAVEAPSPSGGTPSPGASASATPPSTSTPPSSATPPNPTTGNPPSTPQSWPVTAWSPNAIGCGSFQVVGSSVSKQELVVLGGDRHALGLENVGDSVTVDLSGNGQRIGLRVEHYAKPLVEIPYCTDVLVGPPQQPTIFEPIQGQVKIVLSGAGREGDTYAVTVSLLGVVVRAPDGTLESISGVTFQNVTVGWAPG